jgi:hypothetical protein
MKKLIVSMLVVASGCASKVLTHELPSPQNGDAVMQLFGRWAIGHACPCDGLILTAAHVAHPLYLRNGHKDEIISYAWSDHLGNEGYVGSAYLMLARDLGVLRILSGSPHYYRHAPEKPVSGDVVSWKEYDYRSRRHAYAPRIRTATVVRLVAGHLILDDSANPDDPANPGASGTCLFNEMGQVVGIPIGHKRLFGREYVSVAVSVWGPWWPGGQP